MKNCPHFLREAAGKWEAAAKLSRFQQKGGGRSGSGGKFGVRYFYLGHLTLYMFVLLVN